MLAHWFSKLISLGFQVIDHEAKQTANILQMKELKARLEVAKAQLEVTKAESKRLRLAFGLE